MNTPPDYGEPWQDNQYWRGSVMTRAHSPVIDNCLLMKRALLCVNALAGVQDPAAHLANLNKALAENAGLRAALQRIADCIGAPDIDPVGEVRFALHCGVEDTDRYDGADYGFACGTERALVWASNEAKHALLEAGKVHASSGT